MNKKFVATLALVLIAATAFAGVNFTGTFKAGYVFSFTDGVFAATPKTVDGTAANTEAYMYLKAADDGGLWTVTFKGTAAFNESAGVKAGASLNLGKALATKGVDLGDFGIVASIGANSNMSGLNVYTDPFSTIGDNGYKLRSAGGYSAGLTLNYAKLVKVNFASNMKTPAGDGTNDFNFVLSASSEPVDGIQLAVGYANKYQNKHTSSATFGKNGVDGSVTVNVAKLAGLDDISLSVSAHDLYLVDAKLNYLTTGLSFGIAKVGAYVEYTLYDNISGIKAKVSYSGIEDLGMYAKFVASDFANFSDSITVSGGADYTMGGVKYSLDLAYAIGAKKFSITPACKITF
ncbi:MAG: hypothetical protein SPD11_06625 [Sphaerochaetaceae bacterium]|nr:hypothetical protein [Sphaerochaetaceae bacterium]